MAISRFSTRFRKCVGSELLALLFTAFLATPPTVSAKSAERKVAVDLELILAVDISDSMSPTEQRLQRDGYVSAFRHPEVIESIQSGAIGRIAVLYLEWAGASYQRVGVPWTVVANRKNAFALADLLAALPMSKAPGTSISNGLLTAGELFSASTLRSERRVIDISGDGVNNFGPPVAPIRDTLISEGININGLPIVLPADQPDTNMSFSKPFLERYYKDCVIGGPGAFVIAVGDMSLFESALRQKLVTEIAMRPTFVLPASYVPPLLGQIDCTGLAEQIGR